MCYIGYLDDESSVARVATEDIKVYKVMKGNAWSIKSPIMEYEYPLARLQSSGQLEVMFTEELKVFEHPKDIIVIDAGLHSFNNYNDSILYVGCNILTECYIPKGSVYFYNKRDYVSQELIFDKSYDKNSYIRYYSASIFKRFFMKKPKPIYIWKD